MRRSEKEIHDQNTILHLLRTIPVGHLATNGKDGYPHIKPVLFIFLQNAIYLHTAKIGEKIWDIQDDPRVTFEVALPLGVVVPPHNQPICKTSLCYRSVIIQGKAKILSDPLLQQKILEELMRKYVPKNENFQFSPDSFERNGIMEIVIEKITGKEDLSHDPLKTRLIQELASAQYAEDVTLRLFDDI